MIKKQSSVRDDEIQFKSDANQCSDCQDEYDSWVDEVG